MMYKTSAVFVVSILLVFLVFILRLYGFQINDGNSYELFSSRLAINSPQDMIPRGVILDRNSNILLKNEELYNIKVYNIANIDTFLKEYSKYKITNSSNQHLEIANLTNFEIKILQKKLELEGYKYEIDTFIVRDYLYPYSFSHIIGYTGLADEEDIKNGYKVNVYRGKYKLEQQLEENLKGVGGKKLIIDGVEYHKQGEPGQNVYLTVDKNWQNALYNIIQNHSNENNAAGGAGVIVDDSNGSVIAMVSFPGFDSNLFVRGISNSDYQDLLKDRRKPLIDKAIGLGAAPGSTFKIISSYNLLENGIIDSSSSFFSNRCMDLGGGYNFCEFGKFFYGDMNIVRALYKSSNLFFCNFTLQDYRANKFGNFLNAAKLFNIGDKTGIDLIGELAGNLDSPEYKVQATNEKWFDGDTCNAAIGQGAILTTPIQMAMVASVVNNNGIYYKPYLVEKVRDIFGNTIVERKPEIQRVIPFKEDTLKLIKEGMYDVVHNPEGTVYVFLNDVPGNVRAKTGTAEVYENVSGKLEYRTHGWIIGSFDYKDKSYSFAFHLSYGGGGFYIARAAKDFLNCLYNDFQGCL